MEIKLCRARSQLEGGAGSSSPHTPSLEEEDERRGVTPGDAHLQRAAGWAGKGRAVPLSWLACVLPCHSQEETIPPPSCRLALKRIKEIITGWRGFIKLDKS